MKLDKIDREILQRLSELWALRSTDVREEVLDMLGDLAQQAYRKRNETLYLVSILAMAGGVVCEAVAQELDSLASARARRQ